MVNKINLRDGWTSKSAMFLAELVDLKSDSRVGYVPSKLASQMVDDDWAAERHINPIVTELAVLTGEANVDAQEAVNSAEEVVSIDWNKVEISDRTDLIIAPMSDIQMAILFGIPVDDKDKEKERDETADEGNIHAADDDADIDSELMQNAAVHVHDGHANEFICVYDKEIPVIEVGRLFPSMDEFRMCFRTCAVRHEFAVKTLWHNKKKFYAKCKGFDGGANHASRIYLLDANLMEGQ